MAVMQMVPKIGYVISLSTNGRDILLDCLDNALEYYAENNSDGDYNDNIDMCNYVKSKLRISPKSVAVAKVTFDEFINQPVK